MANNKSEVIVILAVILFSLMSIGAAWAETPPPDESPIDEPLIDPQIYEPPIDIFQMPGKNRLITAK